ncbi:hypothetical protein GCM10007094_01440 [Pseudovibrio japonicus]|uniref:Uncharacterized protein n=1 Tax=Pseudovibrio japonicus TaxID=366534 RepID=A0ABQ3E0Y5_9HYPH|nr:hypothetical protein [Pseudovibrio japonicus]GHB17621.1 hypothetical protein GCM10007094_01440 [Pseudovibrio japonicus]
MPFKNSRRQGFFAVSSAVFCLYATSALSSPASDLVDKYNDWFLANGATTASYASAVDDGANTQILDHKIEGMFSFSLDKDKPELGVYYAITTPKTVYLNGSRSGDTFSFESISTEGMQFEVGFFETSDAIQSIQDARTSSEIFHLDGDAKDYIIESYSENWMDLPVVTDGITTEEFQQLLAATTRVSYYRSHIAELSANSTILNGVTGEYTLKNFEYMGARDGFIEANTIEEYTYTTNMSGFVDGQDVSTTSETKYSDIEILDQDIRPILALLGAGTAPSDLVTSLYRVGSFATTVNNGASNDSEPFGIMEMTAGSSVTEEVRISGGDATKLFAAMEGFSSAASEAENLDNVYSLLDALGSFSIAYSDVNDIQIKAWDPISARMKDTKSPSFEVSLDHASTTDLTTNSLGQIKVEGLYGAVESEDAVFDLDSFELADIEWPSLRTIVESAMLAQVDPSAALDAIPTIGLISISGLSMQSKELDTPVVLDELSIEMDNHIGPIPTRLSEVIDGLSFDAALLEEPTVLGMLDRLGIERVHLTQDFHITWDETTEDLTLEKFEFDLENGLRLRADIQIGNIPRALFERPHEAEAVIALATFKGAQIEVMDSPLISEMLETQAEQAGVPAELLASMLIDGTVQQAGPLAKTEFALELAKAAKSFVGNPTNIRVTLAPEAAVPLLQLGGLAALAPQQLPKLLGASVSYTE